MKRLLLFCLVGIMCAGSNKTLAQNQSTKPDIFHSLAVGVSAGTTGIGLDVSSPIGNYVSVRAGVSFMPNFTYSTNVDVYIEKPYEGELPDVRAKGSMRRTTGELLLNVYPFKSSSFFVCGGAYFGGSKFIKIKGHSDELAKLIAEGKAAGIKIGKYSLPVDANGNVYGGLKVAAFRPYLGVGFGRSVPKDRIGFMCELGVQFHNTPKVYAKNADLTMLDRKADDHFSNIIDKLKVYPVLKFRLCGKIF
jgi:hypothetical protein